MVLSQVWATAEAASQGIPAFGTRKGPHSLILLATQAQAAVQAQPKALEIVREAAQEASQPRCRRNPAPELAFYRKYTEAILRRYMKLSLEVGRVPSLLGRELFRGNISHGRVTSFEDVVIFVHDVDQCLNKLSPGQQHLVRRIALQEYTQSETSAMLGISLRTVVRRYTETLDALTRMLLDKRMLSPKEESGGGV